MKKVLFILMAALLSVMACTRPEGYRNQSNKEFAKTISGTNVQLIDVRTPEEFRKKHIPGAVNIDVQNSGFRTDIKKLDKKYPVAVYCRSGARSRKAAKILTEEGYKVINLDKGITGWDGPTQTQVHE